MKITELSVQKRDSSRFNISVDGKFFCGASVDIVAKFNLYQGRETDEKELREILDSELEIRFLNRALTYLIRSPRSEYQIRTYLRNLAYKKKGLWYEDISKEQLEEIFEKNISKLKEFKYINDREYAEAFVNSRIRNKPRGKNILVAELRSKGVNKELALEVVEELVEDEADMLKRIYTKKYGEEKLEGNDRKKIDFLRRKGFNWDLIQKYIQDEFGE